MKKALLILVVPILFFIFTFITLRDYGISWDESEHFIRGQAYLHYFLSGKLRYDKDLTNPSYFQNNSLPGEFWLMSDTGHPPLADILAASYNYIFFQKLNIFGDIESYHLFNITVSTLLVFTVVLFAYLSYGPFPAVVSGLTLSLYPLFFSESHFNLKDPSQTAFYAFTIFAFWMSVRKKMARWLLIAALSFAAAFSIKFNVVFIPLIIVPYLIIRFFPSFKIRKIPKPFILATLVSPLIVLIIFFGSWPFLWQDPIGNFLKTIDYYVGIGTGTEPQPGYFLGGFNLYPIIWIITTTPPVVLFLTLFGIFVSLKDRTKDKTSVLWLLWLLIPIFRVTLPATSIYGGVRQIMEYLPAMALLSGLGAHFVISKIKKSNPLRGQISKLHIKNIKIFDFYILFLIFAFLFWPLAKYHPHENVYFNFLVGGLKGAKEKNIPYWGNSYGNAYKPAIDWLNKNAEKNARLALIQGTSLNVPQIMLRNDISFWNQHWSGSERKGEYLMELTYNDPIIYYPYAWEYVENFLEPIYEVRVDGVAIAKVWKNDWEHTKEEMKRNEKKYPRVGIEVDSESILIKLDNIFTINKFVIHFDDKGQCSPVKGMVEISRDLTNWAREAELASSNEIGKLVYYFAAREGKAIRFIPFDKKSCVFSNSKVEVFILE